MTRRARFAVLVALMALMGPTAVPSRVAESLRLVAAIEWLGDVQAPVRAKVTKARIRRVVAGAIRPTPRQDSSPRSTHFPLTNFQLPPPAEAAA